MLKPKWFQLLKKSHHQGETHVCEMLKLLETNLFQEGGGKTTIMLKNH